MSRTNLAKNTLVAIIFTFISPVAMMGQEGWQGEWIDEGFNGFFDSTAFVYDDHSCPALPYYRDDYCDDEFMRDCGCHSMDYHYRYGWPSHRYGQSDSSFKSVKSTIRFGRSFDNSDNFSSGLSSYQGTSTGSGPNGGYTGTPRGTYETHYFNKSLNSTLQSLNGR